MERLVTFYVEQHNTFLPHAAFAGQTPDEMYFGRGDIVPGELAAAHSRARDTRMAANRALSCESCRTVEVQGEPKSFVDPDVLQLYAEESGMS